MKYLLAILAVIVIILAIILGSARPAVAADIVPTACVSSWHAGIPVFCPSAATAVYSSSITICTVRLPDGRLQQCATPQPTVKPKQAQVIKPAVAPTATPDPATVLLNAVYADLSSRVGQTVNAGNSTLTQTATTWPNAGLGCPKLGYYYAQVTLQGYDVAIQFSGHTYDYHTPLTPVEIILCSVS